MFALISDEILLSMNLRSNLKIKRIIEFLEKRYGKEIKEYYTQKSDPFNVLISCVLSQRTREENTAKAVKDLFSIASSPEEILKIPDERLQELIKPAGFYRQKSKHIKQICKILLDEHNGNVPKKREELLKLPGIGYKTADVTLCYGHGIPTVAVDTHVNRISKRLGLVDEKANIEFICHSNATVHLNTFSRHGVKSLTDFSLRQAC